MNLASVSDYREAARRRLPKVLYDYIDGGSYAEVTAANNVHHLNELSLRQRVLKDKHLKLRLTIGQQRFDAIQFNFTTTPGREIHAAYRLAVNDYNGVQSVQLMIEHLQTPV